MSRMFCQWPKQKMVLDAALLDTQHYEVSIKSKVEKFSVVAIEKGAFGLPLPEVANLTYYVISESSISVELLAHNVIPYILKYHPILSGTICGLLLLEIAGAPVSLDLALAIYLHIQRLYLIYGMPTSCKY